MSDRERTREELIAELAELRLRVADQDAQLARARQINDSLPVLVATTGRDGYHKEVNAAFERILGWSEQESLSRPFVDFIHPDDRAAAVASFQRLISGNTAADLTDRSICKDGSSRQIHWTWIPALERDIVVGIGRDVTEMKQAEDESRRSEARWRAVVGNAPAQIATVDREGNLLFINRPVPGLALEDVIGRSVYEFLEPEFRELGRRCVEQVFRTGETTVNESMATGPHGTRSWYETRLAPVTVDGQVVAVTLISTDITDRKQAELALRESERRLATLMSNLPGMAYRCRNDREWSMGFVSRGCEQLTGYQASDLTDNRTIAYGEIIHPEDRKGVWDQVQQAVANRRRFQLEYRIRTAHAQERWVWEQGVGVLSDDGKLEAIEGFITDISDWKRAEEELQRVNEQLEQRVLERTAELTRAAEALRRSEVKYRTLVESSPEAVVMCDLEGRISFASRRAAEHHKVCSPDEMVGRWAVDFVVEPERARFQASVGRLIDEGLRQNIEYRLLREDGSVFDAEISSAVIFDAAGNPEALMAVYRDISDRKEAAEKLAREQRALRRMVLASDHDRRLITYELHDGVAQQILGATMHLQALAAGTGQASSAAAEAHRQGMDALGQASLELRRIMSRLRTPVLDRFGLAAAIEDVAAQLRSMPGAPAIAFRHSVALARLEPTLENSLFRIAQEALTNACRHSKSEKVRVRLRQRDDRVTLEVRDWGIGYRPGAVTENRFGLEGIRERTRVLGGRLSIRSRPGRGTVLRVRFPVLSPGPQG